MQTKPGRSQGALSRHWPWMLLSLVAFVWLARWGWVEVRRSNGQEETAGAREPGKAPDSQMRMSAKSLESSSEKTSTSKTAPQGANDEPASRKQRGFLPAAQWGASGQPMHPILAEEQVVDTGFYDGLLFDGQQVDEAGRYTLVIPEVRWHSSCSAEQQQRPVQEGFEALLKQGRFVDLKGAKVADFNRYLLSDSGFYQISANWSGSRGNRYTVEIIKSEQMDFSGTLLLVAHERSGEWLELSAATAWIESWIKNLKSQEPSLVEGARTAKITTDLEAYTRPGAKPPVSVDMHNGLVHGLRRPGMHCLGYFRLHCKCLPEEQ